MHGFYCVSKQICNAQHILDTIYAKLTRTLAKFVKEMFKKYRLLSNCCVIVIVIFQPGLINVLDIIIINIFVSLFSMLGSIVIL